MLSTCWNTNGTRKSVLRFACGGGRCAPEVIDSHKAYLGIQVWSTAQVEGVHRFLARSYRLVTECNVNEAEPSDDQLKSLHIAIKRVCP